MASERDTPAHKRQTAGSSRLILRNAGFLTGGAGLQRVLGFAIAIVLARGLGREQFGILGIATAFMGFGRIALRSGISPMAIREVARNPGAIRPLMARVVGLRLAIALLFGLGILVAGEFLEAQLGVPSTLLAIYALTLLPEALRSGWALRGLERMDLVAYVNVFERAAVLAGLLLVLRGPSPQMWSVPVIEAAAGAAVVLGFGLLLQRGGHLRRASQTPVPGWRELFGETASVTAASLLRSVYVDGHVLLIGIAASPATAGIFLVSHRIMLSIGVIPNGLQQAAFPLTSRLAGSTPAAAIDYQGNLLRLSLLLLVPIAILVSLLAPRIVELFFGAEFAPAAAVLQLAIWTLPFLAAAGTCRALLLACGGANEFLTATTLGALAHVAFGIALIPWAGALGAAGACLLGEAVGTVAMEALLRRRLGRGPLTRMSLSPLGVGALALAIVALSGLPRALQAGLSLALYAALSLLLGTTTRAEIRRGLSALVHAARGSR